jgi:hypothetical protein
MTATPLHIIFEIMLQVTHRLRRCGVGYDVTSFQRSCSRPNASLYTLYECRSVSAPVQFYHCYVPHGRSHSSCACVNSIVHFLTASLMRLYYTYSFLHVPLPRLHEPGTQLILLLCHKIKS